MRFAVVKGTWSSSYTGTGMFFPESVQIVDTEDEAGTILNKAADEGHDWYVVPVEEP